MTPISAASTNTYQSPLQKLQDELSSEVNSGAVSSSPARVPWARACPTSGGSGPTGGA